MAAGVPHALPGPLQRMLRLAAKRLCRDGMVERIAYPTIRPQVEYRLTETGQSLAAAIGALADWSREHKDRIADARRHRDAEHDD
ncbi:winged helix-turn-helix transcriptional regulator [Nocardia beijingensis]